MTLGQRIRSWDQVPIVRSILFLTGWLLIMVSPVVGAIPGPGGVFVFAAGLGLILKYSGWAKRQYVKFKRRHPNKGRWADWGMRRASARRREARLREAAEAGGAALMASAVPESGLDLDAEEDAVSVPGASGRNVD